MKTVILAAGFGSRLWPLSTSEKPKQFQSLIHGETPLGYTYQQLARVIPKQDLYVLSLNGLEAHITAILPGIDPEHIILVPARRNTLPHTVWALRSMGLQDDEPILFKSVDHYLRNPDDFVQSLRLALESYDQTKPVFKLLCTKYESYNSNDGYCIVDQKGSIRKFLEKPSRQALEAAADGQTIFRSPFMYMTSKHVFDAVLQPLSESWAKQALALLHASESEQKQLFLAMPMIDISSTVFQTSDQLTAGVIDYDYIDIGRFEEVYELNDKDEKGNVIIGDIILGTDCQRCLILNETDRPMVVMSQQDMVIVQSAAGTFVSPFTDAAKIGDIYKTKIYKQ